MSHTTTHSSKESAGIPYPFTEDEREAIKGALTSLNDGLLKDKMHLEIMDMDTVTGPAATHAKYLIRKIQDCKFFLGIVEFDGISKWSQKEYAKALRLKKWGKLREIFMFVRKDNGRRSEVNDKRFFNGSSSDNPWINEYESPAELKSGIMTAFERHYNEYEKYQKRRDRIIRIVLAAIAFLLGLSLLCVIFREPINKWIHPDDTQQIDSTFVIESKSDNSNEVVSREGVEGENSGSHNSSSSRPPTTDGNKGRASGKPGLPKPPGTGGGGVSGGKNPEPIPPPPPVKAFDDNAIVIVSDNNDSDIVSSVRSQLLNAHLGLTFQSGGNPQWRVILRETVRDTSKTEYQGMVWYDPTVSLYATIFNSDKIVSEPHAEKHARVYDNKEEAINAARIKALEDLIPKIIEYFNR